MQTSVILEFWLIFFKLLEESLFFYGFTLSCNKSVLFYADTIWQDTGIKEVRSGFNFRFYMCSTDIWLLTEYSLSPLLKNETVHFLFHFWLRCFQVQLLYFSPTTRPTPVIPIYLLWFHPHFAFLYVSFIVVPANSSPLPPYYPLPPPLRLFSCCSQFPSLYVLFHQVGKG